MTHTDHTADRVLVVVPTYNERDNIEPLVGKIEAVLQEPHLLFVDDGSPDGTAAEVRRLAAHRPGRVHLIEREGKQGLGTAYRAGFQWALSRPYAYIFQMDADHSHDPADLPRLRAEVLAGKGDFAVGSRYVKGGSDTFTRRRRWLSRGGSLYARTILGVRVRDLTGGFKCWRRDVLEAIDLSATRAEGYAFQIETTYRAILAGYRPIEVPIHFGQRAAGDSKMSARIMLEALAMMWRLRWNARR